MMDDHDLLIEAITILKELQKSFDNHIKHHWMLTIPLLMAVVGLIITLLIK